MSTIVLCDAHDEFRRALSEVMAGAGFLISGEAVDGVQAVQQVGQRSPDILVIELNCAIINGFEVTRRIVQHHPDTRVVMLSMCQDDVSVLESFRAGVKAYVLKSHAARDIVLALNQVQRGKHFLSPAITDQVIESYHYQYKNHSGVLTGIETEILKMLSRDKAKSDIARELGITVECLEDHRKSVMDKLHASNIGGLVRHAVRQGMLNADPV